MTDKNHNFNIGDWVLYQNIGKGHGKIIAIDGDNITCEMLPGFAKIHECIITDKAELFKLINPASRRQGECGICRKLYTHDKLTPVLKYGDHSQIDHICPECLQRWYRLCAGCGKHHYKTGMVEAEGKLYCSDCLKTFTTVCWCCGQWIHPENLIEQRGGLYCINCRDTGKMDAYLEHISRRNLIEIGDYLISATSGLVQGTVTQIGTIQGFGDETVYLVERKDGKQFTIPSFDIENHIKPDGWYNKQF